MKFYRGDSIPKQVQNVAREDRGRTFADHFCGTGLMAKFTDGGSSKLLRGKELIHMILSHVGYERNQPEQQFSYRSPFLSFTQDLALAFDFADRTGKKNLEECPLDKASSFIWELDLDLPSEVEPGRYEFLYKASSKNCVRLVEDQIKRGFEHQALTGDAHNLAMGIMNWAALVCADADTRYHRAELIDVVTYVRGRKNTGCDSRLVSNTLDRAGRSREWLLYPTTPMEDGLGISARFAMNQHLRVYQCTVFAISRPQPKPRLKTDVENARLSGSLFSPRLSRIALESIENGILRHRKASARITRQRVSRRRKAAKTQRFES